MSEHARIVGERIKKFRSNLGLTQSQLASRVGMGASSLSPLEAGRFLPNLNAARVLARIFNISMDELMSEEEDKSSARVIAEKIEKNESLLPPLNINDQAPQMTADKMVYGVYQPIPKKDAYTFSDFMTTAAVDIEDLRRFYNEFIDIYELSTQDRMLVKMFATRLMEKGK